MEIRLVSLYGKDEHGAARPTRTSLPPEQRLQLRCIAHTFYLWRENVFWMSFLSPRESGWNKSPRNLGLPLLIAVFFVYKIRNLAFRAIRERQNFVLFSYDSEGWNWDEVGGHEDRHSSIVALFRHAYETISPELLSENAGGTFLVYTGDAPHEHSNWRQSRRLLPRSWRRLPILSIARTKYSSGLSGTFPCFAFGGWTGADLPNYTNAVEDIRTSTRNTNWDIDKLYWAGHISHPSRATYAELSRKHPELIENNFVVYGEFVFARGPDKGHAIVTAGAFVPMVESSTKYSQLIDIEGTGYSGRLKYMLYADRALFIQGRPYWDAATYLLKAWEHYIPVKRDFSDLFEKIEWARQNPDDVKTMNERRLQFAFDHATYDAAISQIQQEILLRDWFNFIKP